MGRFDYAARTKMIEFVKAHGWELDPEARRTGPGFGRGLEQDPFAFTKAADNSGTWKIKLDYRERGGSWSTSYGNLLQRVEIKYFDADGKRPFLKTEGWEHNPDFILSRPGKYDSYNGLWVALGSGKPDRSLPKRAELLVRDIDLVIWLGAEKDYEEQVRQDVKTQARREDAVLRSRPLPITIPEGQYYWDDGTFKNLVHQLVDAAKEVESADGKSDLPKLVADVSAAFQEVVEVLNDDARRELLMHLDAQIQELMDA